MSNFYPGDVVIVTHSNDIDGQIGVVKGEGNIWDYTVVFPALRDEQYRLDPDQLAKIDLETLIKLASPVASAALAFLR